MAELVKSFISRLAAAYDHAIKDDLAKELHLVFEMHRASSRLLRMTLQGLDDVGEPVCGPGEWSGGIACVEMNIRAAEHYLRDRGILVPM